MSKQPTLFHHIRKAAGLLQVDVADRLGVTQATVSRWDSGAVNAPPEVIDKLRSFVAEAAPKTRAA